MVITGRLIYKLDDSVVNQIAAGEILQRPWNAVKELIENSHDASATSISVVAAEGGLSSLTVTDNGCGINYDDLSLVCERFATSKLTRFEDLQTVQTFGFRGEALASISQVSRLTVVSRVAGSKCAYKAFYVGGKMTPISGSGSADPVPCAGIQGTGIIVDGLFYNLPTRRSSFSADEEYQRILTLCQKYAILWSDICFSCGKVCNLVYFLLTVEWKST